jgi:hypothetical protein
MTPLLIKEGKILIYNTICFSSFLRRSTPDVYSQGEVVSFLDSHNNKPL